MTDYRYRLTRSTYGLGSSGRLCWVMLNPSTADDDVDDPTIRRVIRFTRDHGYADLEVVNLYALRATNPADLLRHLRDGGDLDHRNAAAIIHAFARAQAVVFAWGAWGVGLPALPPRPNVERLARIYGRDPLCLGRTKGGAPRHPLYVSAATRLTSYYGSAS